MIYSLPIIGALIGWITNYIAIKMLFHPRKKINLLFITLQGVFPKRQKKLAQRLGKIVAQELFSTKDIKKALTNPKNTESIKQLIDEKLDHFLNHQLNDIFPLLSTFVGAEAKENIKTTLQKEIETLLPTIFENISKKMEEEINVEEIVQTKVENFSINKLEQILFSIMKKEFKLIEILGGVLGFTIGLIQLLLIL